MPTFADVMTLLMCFFVLLLSFSELDVRRYKQIASSMSRAFGVQPVLATEPMPMGTSIAARDFAPPAMPPTPISEAWAPQAPSPELQKSEEQRKLELTTRMKKSIEASFRSTQADADQLAAKLSGAIGRGEVEVETRGRTIVLRIREKGSFDSGSAELKATYQHLLHDVRDTLARQPGVITVRGHTDDVPIATARFRSNWDLSSARAVSVAHELLAEGVVDRRRVSIAGYADTRPLVPNDNPEHRARNRRVEIVIDQGFDRQMREDLEVLKANDRSYYDSLQLGEEFGPAPEEVF
jgi:chemotaxis protein MotB